MSEGGIVRWITLLVDTVHVFMAEYWMNKELWLALTAVPHCKLFFLHSILYGGCLFCWWLNCITEAFKTWKNMHFDTTMMRGVHFPRAVIQGWWWVIITVQQSSLALLESPLHLTGVNWWIFCRLLHVLHLFSGRKVQTVSWKMAGIRGGHFYGAFHGRSERFVARLGSLRWLVVVILLIVV